MSLTNYVSVLEQSARRFTSNRTHSTSNPTTSTIRPSKALTTQRSVSSPSRISITESTILPPTSPPSYTSSRLIFTARYLLSIDCRDAMIEPQPAVLLSAARYKYKDLQIICGESVEWLRSTWCWCEMNKVNKACWVVSQNALFLNSQPPSVNDNIY